MGFSQSLPTRRRSWPSKSKKLIVPSGGDVHFWENTSNGNTIVAAILLASSDGAAYVGWLLASIPLGIAGLLSIVWNESVAKTTTIIGCWIVAGAGSAWLLGMLCNSVFGMSAVGYFAGLAIGIAGVMKTID